MIKLIIFDIDNTLAKSNKPIGDVAINFLKKTESSGISIALISGKPTVYISGLARQIGLINPIISGENGAYIYYSSSFPPQKEIVLFDSKKGTKKLDNLKLAISKEFGEKIWIQPNLVNLTLFPKTKMVKYKLFRFVSTYASDKSLNKFLKIYEHSDSIELVPLKVDKGFALRKIKTLKKLKKDEVIAVGDAENDIPIVSFP
jgi:HAD superfamily hydrolase (TIGR01484 family)